MLRHTSTALRKQRIINSIEFDPVNITWMDKFSPDLFDKLLNFIVKAKALLQLTATRCGTKAPTTGKGVCHVVNQ